MRTDQIVAIAKALADPTRLQILRKLRAAGTMTCGDVCGMCNLAQPTISHHIKTLVDAGLIDLKRKGPYHILTPNERALRAFAKHVGEPAAAGKGPAARATGRKVVKKTA